MSSTLHITAEFKLHPNIHSISEEWSGITDPVIRRKLQNRLNQRAARRRKAEKLQPIDGASTNSDASGSPSSGAKDPPCTGGYSRSELPVIRAGDWVLTGDLFNKTNNSAFVSLRDQYPGHRFEEVDRVRRSPVSDTTPALGDKADGSWHYTLPADHLLTLVYYNVYKALATNIAVLGLDLNLMYSDDYPTPFTPMSPTATSSIHRLPSSLQPTLLQKSIDHHPQWDVIPDRVIRDNLLTCSKEDLDEEELCCDMIGGDLPGGWEDSSKGPAGFIVWGQPWDVGSWEVTERFARRWPQLLKNAVDTMQSTNKWRLSRGEVPLDFDRILTLE